MPLYRPKEKKNKDKINIKSEKEKKRKIKLLVFKRLITLGFSLCAVPSVCYMVTTLDK